MVIGESSGRNHMGLYGHPRATIPKLKSMASDLLIFKDIISSATHAVPSLKDSLRFGSLEKNGQVPSVTELFNITGFKSFWISNQTAPTFSGNFLKGSKPKALY